MQKLVRLYRRAERLQDTEAAKERHDNRQMSYHYDHDGCLVIKGRFPAEQGALIVKALEMAMENNLVGAAHGRDRRFRGPSALGVNVERPLSPIAAAEYTTRWAAGFGHRRSLRISAE